MPASVTSILAQFLVSNRVKQERQLVNCCPLPSALLTLNGQLSYSNGHFLAIFNRPMCQLQGNGWYRLALDSDRSRLISACAKISTGEIKAAYLTAKFSTEDGQVAIRCYFNLTLSRSILAYLLPCCDLTLCQDRVLDCPVHRLLLPEVTTARPTAAPTGLLPCVPPC